MLEKTQTTICQPLLRISRNHISGQKKLRFVAKEAGVPLLLITHVLPPVPPLLINPFLRDARAIHTGEVRMANDGTLAKLPVNSNDIIITELFG